MRSSSAISAPRLRCALTRSSSSSRSAQRSGRTISRQIRDGSALSRPTTGHVVRIEESTSSAARGSRLTNRISPSGISGRPTSSAAARARESNENSASWASAAASSSPPRTSTAPSLPRISASRPNDAAGGDLDDRLEVRAHQPMREELGEPVGAGAVEQRLGRQRERLLVGQPDGEQAGALGLGERLQQRLEPVVPAGSGQLEPLDGDVALGRLGGEMLHLVEHGGTMRQEPHAVRGLCLRGVHLSPGSGCLRSLYRPRTRRAGARTLVQSS